jgi:hypothetical protein
VTWQDPYGQPGWQGGQTPPGWQDPYAQQGYGQYGPPGGAPPASNGAAIAALVANIVAAVLCCTGIAWLPGVILASIAISRTPRDPESARSLTVWSWVCFAINVVLTIALVVILALAGVFESSTST